MPWAGVKRIWRGKNKPQVADSFRLSTSNIPYRARAAAIRDAYTRIAIPGKLEPLQPLPNCLVGADITKRALPGLEFMSGTLCGLSQNARPEGAPHTYPDELFVAVNVAGSSLVRQGQRELFLQSGEALVATRGNAGFTIFRPTPVRFVGMRVPQAAIRPFARTPYAGGIGLISRDNDALRLLTQYLSIGIASGTLTTPESRRLFVAHTYDLIALILGVTWDPEMAAHGSVRAARLAAIKADIIAHLSEPDLSVHKIAAAHRVTCRYVHKLFETEGVTFGEFVRSRRLAVAYDRLTDARFAPNSIASIAYDAGFGDLSTFNHLFRRRYRATPTEARVAATRSLESSASSRR